MAFLVCYSRSLDDHTKDRAAYLPQSFYELIFNVCCDDATTYPVLHLIARLKYHSPTMLMSSGELPGLINELHRLGDAGAGGRDLLASAQEAMRRSCSLTISGDMHPELGGERGEPRRRPWWRFW